MNDSYHYVKMICKNLDRTIAFTECLW